MGCLGVKSAFASLFDTRREYEQKLRARVTGRQKMIKADLNLVAKIIREAIAYAQDLGFKPDPDYRDAMLVLGEADPDACDVPIPLHWVAQKASPSSSLALTTTWTGSWPS